MSTPIKLSDSQVRALRDVREGDPVKSCRGRSQYGARGQVIMSLRRRGLVVSGRDGGVSLTTLGAEYLSRQDARKWREHPFMFVIGCIDSNGAITANPSRENRTHRPEESRGCRWRWNVHAQEFADVFAGTGHLTNEELFAVREWLIARGFTQ